MSLVMLMTLNANPHDCLDVLDLFHLLYCSSHKILQSRKQQEVIRRIKSSIMKILQTYLLLILFTVMSLLQQCYAEELYKVSIYRLATNCDEYCFIWTNPWLTEWNTDVTTTICKEEYDKHDEVEVDIVNIDEENNAEVDVTVYICGCSHTFKVKAVLDSNSYGDFSEIKSCSDFGNCQYIYDHQVQIKIESAGDDGKGDRCNSAVVYGDKLSLLLTFFLVLAELLL